jgi:carboxymethylenebutenolidase
MIYPTRSQSHPISNGDLLIDAYCASPIETGQFPGVIVIQEVYGVNDYIQSVCDRIASWGYVAIAPAMFQRTAPGLSLGYTPEELALGRSHRDQTTVATILSDFRATIAHLTALDQVKPGKLGAIGFCFGGHMAFLGATLPEIGATALFYPSGVAVMRPGGGAPSLGLANRIQGQVLGLFGTADPIIPLEQVEQMEAGLQAAAVDFELVRYKGAGHGFACDRRSAFVAAAAQDAWARVEELFKALSLSR